MFLTGTFPRSLDEKCRFSIPKRLRDALGHPNNTLMYLAPGTDGSLSLYTQEAFSKLAGQLDQGSPTRQDVRAFSRLFFTQAQSVEIDRLGRVRIPPELMKLASLGKEVCLLGVRDHLEIWDRQRWEEYLAQKQSQYDEIAENAFAEGSRTVLVPRGPESTESFETAEAGQRPSQPR
jgi:MraZ protein